MNPPRSWHDAEQTLVEPDCIVRDFTVSFHSRRRLYKLRLPRGDIQPVHGFKRPYTASHNKPPCSVTLKNSLYFRFSAALPPRDRVWLHRADGCIILRCKPCTRSYLPVYSCVHVAFLRLPSRPFKHVNLCHAFCVACLHNIVFNTIEGLSIVQSSAFGLKSDWLSLFYDALSWAQGFSKPSFLLGPKPGPTASNRDSTLSISALK